MAGDVKSLLVHRTGLQPEEQQLFFGGKEKDNEGHLHAEGVRDMSKLLLLEDASSEERKHEEIRKHNEMLKASEAVAEVSYEASTLTWTPDTTWTQTRGHGHVDTCKNN